MVHVMIVNQCFTMNFRHGTGIMHMDPGHGRLSDKSDPPTQFAGYGPEVENFNFDHILSSSFFFHWQNSKSIPSLQILSIPNDCLDNLLLSILVLSFM